MAQTVLGFQWFVDGVGPNESNTLGSLASLANSQPSLAQRLLSFLWLADDLTRLESRFVRWLPVFAIDTPSLVEHLLNLPWLADDITEPESQVVHYFADLAKENLSLAERLMGLPWIADGVTVSELQAVRYVGGLIQEHPLLAEQLLGLPWLVDGVTEDEVLVLDFVEEVIEVAPEVATSAAKFPGGVGDLTRAVLGSMRSMLRNDPSQLQQLTSQPWFQDGLTDEEAALIVVLPSISDQEHAFRGLIEGGYVVSDTFSSPSAVEVDLFVVSRSPFQPDDGAIETLRIGIKVIEDFMGVPWPKTNVIVLSEPRWAGQGNGANYGTHIAVRGFHPGTYCTMN